MQSMARGWENAGGAPTGTGLGLGEDIGGHFLWVMETFGGASEQGLPGQSGRLPSFVCITAKAGSSLGNVSLARWRARSCSPSVEEGSCKCHLASWGGGEIASGRQRALLRGKMLDWA